MTENNIWGFFKASPERKLKTIIFVLVAIPLYYLSNIVWFIEDLLSDGFLALDEWCMK